MFKSLRTRLIIIYSLIIILTILAVDTLILNDYLLSLTEEKKIAFFTYGNMVSNSVAANITNTLYINNILEQYQETTNARYLFIDTSSTVLADSMYIYKGELITNPQIRESLKGKQSSDIYGNINKIMQLAVPVTTGSRDISHIIGVILISTDIDSVFNAYRNIRLKITVVSILAGLLGIFMSLIAAYSISNPLKKLISFSKRLSRGHLGEIIRINREDEIGQLAATINYMSTELHNIENSRKKFIGNVSHELKTPLASIKALVESLLISNNNRERQREFLKDVIQEIDRLSSLIKQLLTFTRLEEETLNINSNNIKAVIDDTIKIMSPLAKSYGVTIENKIRNSIDIPCDNNLVKEMLVNIIDNSIKYRDDKKPLKQIILSDIIEDNTYKVLISDNGIGIPQNDMPLVFQNFFRSEPSRSKEIEGHGMGLTIVRKIADLHRWNIGIESQPGTGTTLLINIPLSL